VEKFKQETQEIYIYDLAVHEQHRRKRVAARLINELGRIARERGAYVIYVHADKADDAAIGKDQGAGSAPKHPAETRRAHDSLDFWRMSLTSRYCVLGFEVLNPQLQPLEQGRLQYLKQVVLLQRITDLVDVCGSCHCDIWCFPLPQRGPPGIRSGRRY
jgi:Acetyltransferase (GNAT) family